MPKLCPNITFPHQQDFFPIRSVTKSSTARFSHENLVEKFKIFVQDFVPIRTALRVIFLTYQIGAERLHQKHSTPEINQVERRNGINAVDMSRLTRDGTAKPVSRDQIRRRERGQGNIHFPCSADHVQDWQPYTVDRYSC